MIEIKSLLSADDLFCLEFSGMIEIKETLYRTKKNVFALQRALELKGENDLLYNSSNGYYILTPEV